tara:strand:+ start:226 stop:408 length:183 start_codon:yes stop_codon:yes gene_type:complete
MKSQYYTNLVKAVLKVDLDTESDNEIQGIIQHFKSRTPSFEEDKFREYLYKEIINNYKEK